MTPSNPLLPAQDYLPDHHVRRNYFSDNYFYIGGRALPGPRLELNLEPAEHSARHALLHMASEWSSHRTTRAGHGWRYIPYYWQISDSAAHTAASVTLFFIIFPRVTWADVGFATAAEPIHVITHSQLDGATAENFLAVIARAGEIIDHLKKTSPAVFELMRQLNISEYQRNHIESQLRHEFETALVENVPPGTMIPLASMFARSTVIDIMTIGETIVVYFSCNTVKAQNEIGRMITSGYMQKVFAETSDSQLLTVPTTVDVYLASPQHKGWLVDIQLYTYLKLTQPDAKICT